MRLGQLSRKIGIQPSRISTFLEGKNYTLEAGSNSKITDKQEELIKTHFGYVEEVAPATDIVEAEESAVDIVESNTQAVDNVGSESPTTDILNSIVEEELAQASDISELQVEEETATAVDNLDTSTPVADTSIQDIDVYVPEEWEVALESARVSTASAVDTLDTDAPAVDTLHPTSDEPSTEEITDEVIRAPKLKLDGLKVIGKIDLPEPKVKEEVAEAADGSESNDTESPVEEVKEKPVRRVINQRKNYSKRPQKRTLTLEEKQERAERDRKRKNKEAKKKQKQLKAAHYESQMRVRQQAPPKKSKRKTQKIQEELIQQDTAPAPKTIFGKFLRWLNT